jgi:hypothetical protein
VARRPKRLKLNWLRIFNFAESTRSALEPAVGFVFTGPPDWVRCVKRLTAANPFRKKRLFFAYFASASNLETTLKSSLSINLAGQDETTI